MFNSERGFQISGFGGERSKRSLKKDMHVINAGCSGDTLQDSVNSLFNKIINYKPDVAVMMHAINDAGLLLVKGNYSERMIQGQDNSFKAIFRILTTKSRVLGFLRDKYAQMAINQEVLINARMINSRGGEDPITERIY